MRVFRIDTPLACRSPQRLRNPSQLAENTGSRFVVDRRRRAAREGGAFNTALRITEATLVPARSASSRIASASCVLNRADNVVSL